MEGISTLGWMGLSMTASQDCWVVTRDDLTKDFEYFKSGVVM